MSSTKAKKAKKSEVLVLTSEEQTLAEHVKEYGSDQGLSLDQQLALIKRTMMPDFTTAEVILTFRRAKAVGADIFARDMWVYKDKKWNLVNVLSRQFLGKKAEENKEFDGLQSGVVYEKDTFEMDMASGKVKHVVSAPDKRGKMIGGWAVAWRRNGRAIAVFANSSDYNKGEYIWKSHPDAMMQKCAESIVLRKFAMLRSDVLGEGEYAPEVNIAPKKLQKPDLSRIATLSSNSEDVWAIQ